MEGRVESVFSADKLPRLFFHECIQSYNVAAIMDLTPGQGTLLEAAIDLRVPVLAFGITETHCEMLEDRLTSYCLQKLVDSSHTLYRQEAEQYLNGDGTWKEPKEETTEASKKRSDSKKVRWPPKPRRKENKPVKTATPRRKMTRRTRRRRRRKKRNRRRNRRRSARQRKTKSRQKMRSGRCLSRLDLGT